MGPYLDLVFGFVCGDHYTDFIFLFFSVVDPYIFGLLDPDPDPLVRGTDSDSFIIKKK